MFTSSIIELLLLQAGSLSPATQLALERQRISLRRVMYQLEILKIKGGVKLTHWEGETGQLRFFHQL